jgi:hypothetical protein
MRHLLGTSWRGLARIAAGAFALTVCFSILPLWAGQNQQQEPATTVLESADQPANQASEAKEPQPAAPANPAYHPVPVRLTLPPGTVITVRTSQFLSSDQSRAGDSFTAELQQPLVADGWVVARHGQTVIGRVAVAKKAGRVKGVSQLGVELSRLILVDGQQLPIHTQLMETFGGTSKGADAEAVGTTTAIGAAIGAAAHGGEGAGIGAAIGAGAGLAGVLLTRGRPTVLPPETMLTFELQSPVTFSTARSQVAFRPVTQADYNQPAPGLRRRTGHFAPPPYPPPYYFSDFYYPWGGYFYPGPIFIGYYGFGGGFHHGFRRR